METLAHDIRDGDIFRWEYATASPDQWNHDRHWCKSRIVIAKNGLLFDTYWGGNLSADTVRWTYEDARKDLELAFIANFDQLDKSPESSAQNYDAADCVNLNHSNSTRGNFYLRRGAKPSPTAMLETARSKRDKAIRDILFASDIVRRMDDAIMQIESGAPLNEIYI